MASQDKMPPVLQHNQKTCWKYCAEFLYRYGNKKTHKDFLAALKKFADRESMLSAKEVDQCYKQLGFHKRKLIEVSREIIAKTPIIVGYPQPGGDGHLVLIVGFTKNDELILENGCLTTKSNVCQAGREKIPFKTAGKVLLSDCWS